MTGSRLQDRVVSRLGVPLRASPMISAAAAVVRARWYLRSANDVGERVRVYGRPMVRNDGRLLVSDRVQLVSTVARMELATGPFGTLEIGSRTFINYGTTISASASVKLGRRCLIGTYVIMLDNEFHCVDPERRLEQPGSRPIVIEDNVWLGARVIVLPGVIVGEGAVVGAGSVVTHDVPPRSIAAGVPAKVIRKL